jgi:hypothetical protein
MLRQFDEHVTGFGESVLFYQLYKSAIPPILGSCITYGPDRSAARR